MATTGPIRRTRKTPPRAQGPLVVSGYARMWPRAVFYEKTPTGSNGKRRNLSRGLEFLQGGGVYVLYRDNTPVYIGKAKKMRSRLHMWATTPISPNFHFWNYFSAFAVDNERMRTELEGILIAALPGTNNGARPKIIKTKTPKEVKDLLLKAYSGVARSG